jgi:serine protease Do
MKKIFVLFFLSLTIFALAGCSFLVLTTTTPVTIPITTPNTTTLGTTADTEIDLDIILSELYNRIYEELYDDVRAEVIADLSAERFDAIYAQVIADILAKIDSGEITVTAESVIAMIYEVAASNSGAVVGVSNLNSSGNTQSIGSGIVYKHTGDKYYVVTNYHVVENGTSYEIEFADGSTIVAQLQGVDELVDLAVLYFTSTDILPVATFGDSDAVTKGTIVLAVGNPSGYEFYNSVTMGIVSGVDRYFDIDNDDIKDMFVNYIQHDASINAGNSGGALFNLAGEVIGINVIIIAATEIEGMGFAIPSNLVVAICSDIELYGYSKQKPVLGITFIDIATTEPSVFTSYGITLPEGINAGFYVIGTTVNASLYGIVAVDDIILQIGDVIITNTTDFIEGFSKYRVGDVITIVVLRGGETLTFTDIILKAKVDK